MVQLRSMMALLVIVPAAALGGCGTDLGECDMAALGGNETPGMLAPHAGQIAVNTSCASGRCHSKTATGENRVGAPADLNFDVVPADLSDAERAKVTAGATKVQDEKEEMWELIDSGEMPPEGQRAAPTAQEKEAIRNWLACGARVVMAPATTAPTTADLTSIYNAMKVTCGACHSAGPDNNFLSGNECDMYNALVGKTSIGSLCKTNALPLVVAGNPDGSLFLQKMNTAPPCGSSMPFGSPMPYAQMAPQVVQSVRDWIMAGAMKPASCP